MSIRSPVRNLASCIPLALLVAACASALPLPSNTYVPRVQTDTIARLGKERFAPFAHYLTAMHNRIHPVFAAELAAARAAHPELDGATDLVVTLEIGVGQEDGNPVVLGVVKSSGSVLFDAVAVTAVRRAGPFGAPPPSIVSPDGKVYLHWDFHLDPIDACSTRNARPYLLGSPPPPTGGTDTPLLSSPR